MKTQKMSFQSIKNVLSRNEMKRIMAGSSGGGGGNGGGGGPGGGSCYPESCAGSCNSDLECPCAFTTGDCSNCIGGVCL